MSNVPRTSGVNNDNTGRNTFSERQSPAYAAVLTFKNRANTTKLSPALLTGPMTINASIDAAGTPYVGDFTRMMFKADATGRTVTFGTGFATAGATAAVAASKSAVVDFEFDGTNWVECGRSLGV